MIKKKIISAIKNQQNNHDKILSLFYFLSIGETQINLELTDDDQTKALERIKKDGCYMKDIYADKIIAVRYSNVLMNLLSPMCFDGISFDSTIPHFFFVMRPLFSNNQTQDMNIQNHFNINSIDSLSDTELESIKPVIDDTNNTKKYIINQIKKSQEVKIDTIYFAYTNYNSINQGNRTKINEGNHYIHVVKFKNEWYLVDSNNISGPYESLEDLKNNNNNRLLTYKQVIAFCKTSIS